MGSFRSWILKVDPRPSRERFLELFKDESSKFTQIGSRLMRAKSQYSLMHREWGDMSSSDWDFMFDHWDEETHSLLVGWGFEIVANPENYKDVNFGSLYRHPAVPKLDVIGKKKYKAEKILWTSLGPRFFFEHLWKSNPSRDPEKLDEHKKFINDYFTQQVNLIEYVRSTTDG